MAALAVCFNFLDVASTYACLRRPGMVELNPFLRLLFEGLGLEVGSVVVLSLKLGLVLLALAAYKHFSERSLCRAACKAVLALCALVGLAASANNLLYLLAF